jgi:hypothetical protein
MISAIESTPLAIRHCTDAFQAHALIFLRWQRNEFGLTGYLGKVSVLPIILGLLIRSLELETKNGQVLKNI